MPLMIRTLSFIQCIDFLSVHFHGNNTKYGSMFIEDILPVLQQNTNTVPAKILWDEWRYGRLSPQGLTMPQEHARI